MPFKNLDRVVTEAAMKRVELPFVRRVGSQFETLKAIRSGDGWLKDHKRDESL
jgi:hypothetical protein